VSVIDEWCFSKCSNLASVTLHEGTETIGYCAFRECTSLTTINYPSTLKEIGDYSFQYDSLLAIPLILPESLTYLGLLAYGDCHSIVTASLPGSLGEVPGELFYGCRSLSTVTLGDGICFIGEQAFNHCPNIDTIFVKSACPPDMGSLSDSTFFTYNSTVVVPCGTRNAYIVYLGWSEFAEIIEDCGDGIDEHDAPDINIYATDGRIVVECADGETVSIHAPHWLTPEQAIALITGHDTAIMRTVCDEDGVGHSECGGCHRTVGEWFKFCPWCGARFIRIERTYIP
jgi:hypothetical protein